MSLLDLFLARTEAGFPPNRVVVLLLTAFVVVSAALAASRPAHSRESGELQTGVAEQVALLLQGEQKLAIQIRKKKAALDNYYLTENGELLWIGTGRMAQLIEKLRTAETEGLFSADYPTDYLQKLMDAVPQTDAQSRAVVELLFSGFFLKFAEEIKAGRTLPRKVDPELYWQVKEIDPVEALRRLRAAADMEAFISRWEPAIPAYKALKAKLAVFREFARTDSWPRIPNGEVLKPGMEDERVPVLRRRLAGDSPAGALAAVGDGLVYDEALVAAVKAFQRTHGLETDGVVGFQTKVALNIPIDERVRQIIVSMERWRWIPEDLGRDYLLVNIAGFYLTRFENGRFAERKKVIVGKPYTRTPAFSNAIKYLEFNPYWNVPYSIAAHEMLSRLQRNPGALSSSFEVLMGGRTINPRTVDWRQYSRSSFPFTVRQKPGPKNALGQVKFMFPNRFNVYLHDTPNRGLFDKTFRSFSHGCVRVHKPIDLAATVLKRNQGWDRARIDAVLAGGKRTVVNLQQPLPVHIVYSTAWVAEDASVRFAVDFYHRDEKLYQALFGKPVPWRGG
jgi:murein L,D-transpeptidase YcbB/YkuD